MHLKFICHKFAFILFLDITLAVGSPSGKIVKNKSEEQTVNQERSLVEKFKQKPFLSDDIITKNKTLKEGVYQDLVENLESIEVDNLSQLPDQVLLKIFSYLPEWTLVCIIEQLNGRYQQLVWDFFRYFYSDGVLELSERSLNNFLPSLEDIIASISIGSSEIEHVNYLKWTQNLVFEMILKILRLTQKSITDLHLTFDKFPRVFMADILLKVATNCPILESLFLQNMLFNKKHIDALSESCPNFKRLAIGWGVRADTTSAYSRWLVDVGFEENLIFNSWFHNDFESLSRFATLFGTRTVEFESFIAPYFRISNNTSVAFPSSLRDLSVYEINVDLINNLKNLESFHHESMILVEDLATVSKNSNITNLSFTYYDGAQFEYLQKLEYLTVVNVPAADLEEVIYDIGNYCRDLIVLTIKEYEIDFDKREISADFSPLVFLKKLDIQIESWLMEETFLSIGQLSKLEYLRIARLDFYEVDWTLRLISQCQNLKELLVQMDSLEGREAILRAASKRKIPLKVVFT